MDSANPKNITAGSCEVQMGTALIRSGGEDRRVSLVVLTLIAQADGFERPFDG